MVVVGPTPPWLHLSPSWTPALERRLQMSHHRGSSSAVGLLAEGNLSQFIKTNWGNNSVKYDACNYCLFSLDLERVNILQETPGLSLPRDDGGDRSGQMLGGVLCLHYDYDGQPRYPAVAGTGQLANKRRQFTGGHFSFTHFKYLVSQKTFKL